MKRLLDPLFDACRGRQRKPTVILFLSAPWLLVWKYYFGPEQCASWWPASPESAASSGAATHFVCSLAMLGLLPAGIVWLGFGERLRDYGVTLGNARQTVRCFLLWAPLFVLAGYGAAGDPAIAGKFPLDPLAGQSVARFASHLATYALFYAGWEFYFRGFMLFGLRDALGATNAVLIQTLASALLHIGSPAAETFGAILGGLLWGVLALRTRSLLSGLGQHYLLGATLDACLCWC